MAPKRAPGAMRVATPAARRLSKRRSRARCEATVSRQPMLPHWQRSPPSSTTTWPISPQMPLELTSMRPLTKKPPPTPWLPMKT
jgi:hypothetical protein